MSQILFWDIGKGEVKFFCFYIVFGTDKLVTRHPIFIGFASKCSTFKLSESGVKTQNLNSLTCDSFHLIMSHIYLQNIEYSNLGTLYSGQISYKIVRKEYSNLKEGKNIPAPILRSKY